MRQLIGYGVTVVIPNEEVLYKANGFKELFAANNKIGNPKFRIESRVIQIDSKGAKTFFVGTIRKPSTNGVHINPIENEEEKNAVSKAFLDAGLDHKPMYLLMEF